jgi:hypothetical protein
MEYGAYKSHLPYSWLQYGYALVFEANRVTANAVRQCATPAHMEGGVPFFDRRETTSGETKCPNHFGTS